jgi:hypothetical protein
MKKIMTERNMSFHLIIPDDNILLVNHTAKNCDVKLKLKLNNY